MTVRRLFSILILIAIGCMIGGYVVARNASAKMPKASDSVTSVDHKAIDYNKAIDYKAANIKVLFSPNENVQSEIVRTLNAAKKQILVQAYLLTDNKITHALIAAHQRKVDVRVLLDAERAYQTTGSDAAALAQAGIPVRLETIYENAHNKVMIIDAGTPSAVLLTGSYNFTYTAAKKNAENLLFIRNTPELFSRYVDNWKKHNTQAVKFKTAS